MTESEAEFEIVYDPMKNEENIRKHGVSFADVEPVFYDELMKERPDNDHYEERFVAIGRDALSRVLVVCYTYRDPNYIRLISARKATRKEIATYEAK